MNTLRKLLVLGLLLAFTFPVNGQSRTSKVTRRKSKSAEPTRSEGTAATKEPRQMVMTTASGLAYIVTSRGSGRRPKSGEVVLVHYTGLLSNGVKFDSSRERKEPFAFKLGAGRVIKGWDEAFALLRVGDQATLILPPQLAYGVKGTGGGLIPPNSTLVFVVEVMDVKEKALSALIESAISEKGIEVAIRQYRELKIQNSDSIYQSEGDLNALGYRLLKQKKTREALEIFKLNVESYPQSFNVYDSLAEAYMTNGDEELAFLNYKRSLELNPGNKNAIEMLKKLSGP